VATKFREAPVTALTKARCRGHSPREGSSLSNLARSSVGARGRGVVQALKDGVLSEQLVQVRLVLDRPSQKGDTLSPRRVVEPEEASIGQDVAGVGQSGLYCEVVTVRSAVEAARRISASWSRETRTAIRASLASARLLPTIRLGLLP
jgi:hypothetical protein